MRKRLFLTLVPPLLFTVLSAAACSRHVGQAIDVPIIPAQTTSQFPGRKLNLTVNLTEIRDVRASVVSLDSKTKELYTLPQGNVSQVVQAALANSFAKRGVSVSREAKRTVWGEIRKWQTKVTTTAVSRIESEAALYIEVLDSQGKKVYAGTYHGSRVSQFPVATAQDIKDSLGAAMSQAIAQVLEDEELVASLIVK